MKKSLRMILALLLSATFVFGLAACETTDGTGELVKVYRSTNAGDAISLNWMDSGTVADDDMQHYLFGTLLERDRSTDTWTYIGGFAEGLPEVSEDGLVWTFNIKEGLVWSDGTPINAHTFEYACKMLLNPDTANRNASMMWSDVVVANAEAYALGDLASESGFEMVTWDEVGVNATDDYTLVFTLEQRPLEITAIIALGTAIFPLHEELYEAGFNADRTENTYGTENFMSFPTCGPYTLAQFEAGQFKAYDKDYTYVNSGNWVIERYEFRYVSQQTVSDQLFESNLIDHATVGMTNYDKFSEDPRVVKGTGGQPWHLYVNMTSETNPVLRDVNFRQALFYGVDRWAIAEGVFKVYKASAYFVKTDAFLGNPLIEETVSYRATEIGMSVAPENDGYLPEKALELFDLAYEANGNQKITITLTHFDNADYWRDMCTIIQEQWMALFGADRLEVVTEAKNFNAAYDSYEDGTYELGVGSMTQSSTNPWSSMEVWTSDYSGKIDQMKNAEFDELYKRTTTGDLLFADTETKAAALARMEEILLENVPAIPIMQNTNWRMYAERVTLVNRDWAPGIGWVVGDVIPIELSTLTVE